MKPTTLRARWVVPIDQPPISGGCVTIAAGRIAAVDASPPAGATIRELGDAALLPGLINAHAHLEFSDLTAPLGRPGMPLPEWIRLVIAERKRGARDPATAIAAGREECRRFGVAAIGEISAGPVSYARDAESPTEVTFQESIGFSAQRIDSALADVVRRYRAAGAPRGFSPHAPYTVHPRLLEQIVAAAQEVRAPVAMHLAESPEELRLLASGDGPFRELLEARSMWDGDAIPRGSRPLDYLQRLAAAPRALVVHGNYLAPEEIEFCGQRRATLSVIFCPRTHAYFGHAEYPLAGLRRAGARVALGTDSRASNPDLDLLTEMRFAAARFPQVDPAAWLRMATLDAAEALGLADEFGSLTPGKRAALVAVACEPDCIDPCAAIVGGDKPARPLTMDGLTATGML